MRAAGQTPFSPLLGPALLLMVATSAVHFGGSAFAAGWAELISRDLHTTDSAGVTIADVCDRIRRLAWGGVSLAAPVLIMGLLVCALQGALQTRFLFTWRPLALRLDRLDPASGMRRMFAEVQLSRAATVLLQFCLAVWMAWTAAGPEQYQRLNVAAAAGPREFAQQLTALLTTMLFRFSLVATVWGAVDYGWRFWGFERAIRMTVEEAREELRQEEGAPRTKPPRSGQREASPVLAVLREPRPGG